ncbi:MAG TPA: dNTP triphosphohydrolase [Iamia sp.]
MRDDRFHGERGHDDARSPGARDRDRILYSRALHRLAGVTQVLSPLASGAVHNRLTHSLKVAQIARRLSEALGRSAAADPALAEAIVALGGLDPEVAEAAGLAHDIGHPPFGHLGERTLDQLLLDAGDDEGFNGNAQAFRVLVAGDHDRSEPGLDLTRATLRANLKYPWYRGEGADGPDDARWSAWGAYASERTQFEFASAGPPTGGRSLEAEIVDWADDISYAVHDVEDFTAGGAIPLAALQADPDERERFLALADSGSIDPAAMAHGLDVFLDFSRSRPADVTRWPSFRAGGAMLDLLVNEFVVDHDGPPRARATPVAAATTQVLKQLTAVYVLDEPALGFVHEQQAQLVSDLFALFMEQGVGTRAAADAIAGLDDREALQRHATLFGPELATRITTLTTLPPTDGGERPPALATALAAGRAAGRAATR